VQSPLYGVISRYFGDGALEKREKAEAAFSAAELSAAVARTATYFDFSGLPRGWSGSPTWDTRTWSEREEDGVPSNIIRKRYYGSDIASTSGTTTPATRQSAKIEVCSSARYRGTQLGS
jgi:hypothetical protein